MYNLAPRKSLRELTGTPANVGPGTYYICGSLGHATENTIPFLSTSTRGRSIKLNTDVLYNPVYEAKNVKYGHVLRNRDQRVLYKIEDGPDPTTYNPKPLTRKCIRPPRTNGVGQLYVCKVPLTAGITGPSIPTKRDQNGYNISGMGALVKLPPTDYDQTLGPAFYDVPSGELNYNSFRYGGCAWSRLRAGRSRLVTTDTPGPGHYDPEMVCVCPRREFDEKLREERRRLTQLPRYTHAMMLRVMRQDYPAPGDYDLIDFEKLKKLRKWTEQPVAFQSIEERFHPLVDDRPGPGQYEYCDCAMLKQNFSMCGVPFGVQSKRFRSKTTVTPGPGSYDPNLSNCQDQECYRAAHRPAFGSRSIRDSILHENEYPGPFTYDVHTGCCKDTREASVFKSQVPRFPTKHSGYRPRSAGSAMGQRPFPGRRCCHRRHLPVVPFLSREPKFGAVRDVTFLAKTVPTPCPGAYDPCLPADSVGYYFPLAARGSDRYEESPGPGHYQVDNQTTSSMSRAKITHNVRLKKQVQKRTGHKKPTHPSKPGDKKKLRWFATGPLSYLHCL